MEQERNISPSQHPTHYGAKLQDILQNQSSFKTEPLDNASDISDTYTDIESYLSDAQNQPSSPLPSKRHKTSPSPWTQIFIKPEPKAEPSDDPQDNPLKQQAPGPTLEARTVASPLQSWDLLFSKEMLKLVVSHTNVELSKRYKSCTDYVDSAYLHQTSPKEMLALIGLLYLSGVEGKTDLDLEELWSEAFGAALYRCAMPKRRFELLVSCLRFHDSSSKNQDYFAPVRLLFELFTKNCSRYYVPHENVTLDDLLLPFDGCCSFRTHDPRDPEKIGIRFLTLNDSETSYLVNVVPCHQEAPEELLRRLTGSIQGSFRNVTCNREGMSVEEVRYLMENCSLTMIGRVGNLEGLSEEFGDVEMEGSKVVYKGNLKLLSRPGDGKVELLLASSWCKREVSEEGEPETIAMYEETRKSSETFQGMCEDHSVARPTVRWSHKVFMMILDCCAVNARILYLSTDGNKVLSRREFLKKLVLQLVTPNLKSRYHMPNLRKYIKLDIGRIIGRQEMSEEESLTNGHHDKPHRCSFCPRKMDRKTRYYCISCKLSICAHHKAHLCINCVGAN